MHLRLIICFRKHALSTFKSCQHLFARFFKNCNCHIKDTERSGQPKRFEDNELKALIIDQDSCQTQKHWSWQQFQNGCTLENWKPFELKSSDLERQFCVTEMVRYEKVISPSSNKWTRKIDLLWKSGQLMCWDSQFISSKRALWKKTIRIYAWRRLRNFMIMFSLLLPSQWKLIWKKQWMESCIAPPAFSRPNRVDFTCFGQCKKWLVLFIGWTEEQRFFFLEIIKKDNQVLDYSVWAQIQLKIQKKL